MSSIPWSSEVLKDMLRGMVDAAGWDYYDDIEQVKKVTIHHNRISILITPYIVRWHGASVRILCGGAMQRCTSHDGTVQRCAYVTVAVCI
jgi:hypothetical protein